MDEQQAGQVVEATRRVPGRGWQRPGLYAVAGAAGVGVALAIASVAAASPHHPGTASKAAASGYTLCAQKSGAVIYEKKAKCPKRDTTLSVGTSAQVSKLTAEVKTLTSEVSKLQTLLTGVSRAPDSHGHETLKVSGENLQIVNGKGSESDVNGLGNLIVGYNSSPGAQSGSANLVLGDGQTFTSYGDLVAGESNQASAPYAEVGGQFNVASDPFSFIGGGCNDVTGLLASPAGTCVAGGEGVVGGTSVTATAQDATAGAVSDGVNSGKGGDFKISVGLAGGTCSDVPYGVPGTQIGDVAAVAYETTPPPGLLIETTGVTVTGQVEVEACNVSTSTIHFNNVPIRIVSFR